MSQSPSAPGADDRSGAAAGYRAGWSAITRLLRRGYSWSGHERNVALLNLGDGTFADVSAVAGFEQDDDGRSLVRVDWDGDGDEDVFVSNRTGPRVRFLRNDAPARGRLLALGLEGPPGNPDGIGARVELELAGGGRRVASVRAGEGFLAQSTRWLHVALGEARVEALLVRWPDGEWSFVPNRDLLDSPASKGNALDPVAVVLLGLKKTASVEHAAQNRTGRTATLRIMEPIVLGSAFPRFQGSRVPLFQGSKVLEVVNPGTLELWNCV